MCVCVCVCVCICIYIYIGTLMGCLSLLFTKGERRTRNSPSSKLTLKSPIYRRPQGILREEYSDVDNWVQMYRN